MKTTKNLIKKPLSGILSQALSGKVAKIVVAVALVAFLGAAFTSCDDKAIIEEMLEEFSSADGIGYNVKQVGGNPDGSATSTGLQLTFKSDIEGLTAQDIEVGGPVTVGDLEGSGKVWTLALNEVTAAGEATVAIEKPGIDSAVKKAKVYLAGEVADGDGVEGGTGDDNGNGGAGTGVDNETGGGNETGGAGTGGGNETGGTGTGGGNANNAIIRGVDLKTLLNITTTGAQGVTDTFNAVHEIIIASSTGTENLADRIHVGDWIDLPSLVVLPDADVRTLDPTEKPIGGAINATNVDCANGKLLRLIVVGINSFNDVEYVGDETDNAYNRATRHLVFQFQNIPGFHRMNANADDTRGYSGSEMQTYLNNNFLTGLKAAGVPDGVLWAPSRRTIDRAGPPPSGNGKGLDKITDKLWLPTATEMGSPAQIQDDIFAELIVNQASFAEFYRDDNTRKKYIPILNMAVPYLSATPSYTGPYFGAFFLHGSSPQNWVQGIAPAFCVQ